VTGKHLIFRLHAIQRMFERRIGQTEVRVALENGQVIEDYPDDVPYPSQLVLGWYGMRPLHIVVAHNTEAQEIIVITVYEPDPDQWDSGFRRRKV
jgi:hypothetical protein